MSDKRPITRVEDDPMYRSAMEDARELGIIVEVFRGGTHHDPSWEVYGQFEGQGRSRGRWVDDVWVDSDDDYYGQPETMQASAVSDFPSDAIRIVVRQLVDRASI